jgi:hypothetical protein
MALNSSWNCHCNSLNAFKVLGLVEYHWSASMYITIGSSMKALRVYIIYQNFFVSTTSVSISQKTQGCHHKY